MTLSAVYCYKDLLTSTSDWLNERLLDLTSLATRHDQHTLLLVDQHEFARVAHFMTISAAQQQLNAGCC